MKPHVARCEIIHSGWWCCYCTTTILLLPLLMLLSQLLPLLPLLSPLPPPSRYMHYWCHNRKFELPRVQTRSARHARRPPSCTSNISLDSEISRSSIAKYCTCTGDVQLPFFRSCRENRRGRNAVHRLHYGRCYTPSHVTRGDVNCSIPPRE